MTLGKFNDFLDNYGKWEEPNYMYIYSMDISNVCCNVWNIIITKFLSHPESPIVSMPFTFSSYNYY